MRKSLCDSANCDGQAGKGKLKPCPLPALTGLQTQKVSVELRRLTSERVSHTQVHTRARTHKHRDTHTHTHTDTHTHTHTHTQPINQVSSYILVNLLLRLSLSVGSKRSKITPPKKTIFARQMINSLHFRISIEM